MKTSYWIGFLCLLSCQQKTIHEHYPFASVQIVHQWPDSIVPPEGMRMLFYSYDPLPGIIMQNIHPQLDSLRLIPGKYRILCFSNDSEFLRVRYEHEWRLIQVYIPASTRVPDAISCEQVGTQHRFYHYFSNRIDIAHTKDDLHIQAGNMLYNYHIVGKVEGVHEVSGCKAYLGGMIGALTLCNGEAVGGPGVQSFNFRILSEGIEILLPSLGPYPNQLHPIILEFVYPNGAVKQFEFNLSLTQNQQETIYLPDIQLPTQTIGGGTGDGFQGHIDEWGWTNVPISFE